MILGRKLRNHGQIFSEKLFFLLLEITMILERKLRNRGQIFSEDLFFIINQHNECAAKI